MRSGVLKAYVEAAATVGVDGRRAMARHGLPLVLLRDGEIRVSAGRFSELLTTAAQIGEREDFGLVMAAAFRMSMLGRLGLLVREQPNARAALTTYIRFQGTRTDAVTFRLEEQDDCALVIAESDPALGRSRYLPEFVVGAAARLLQLLIGASWRPQMACFAHAAPEDTTFYRRLFGRTEFGHDFNGLVIYLADLDAVIPTADPEIAAEVARYLTAEAGAAPVSAVREIASIVERLLPTGECTVERLAACLGVDRRTIHRRLAEEGSSFTGLVQEARRQIVHTQLAVRGQTLSELASQLGFSSLSTFSRWFRRTYGLSASAWRAAA